MSESAQTTRVNRVQSWRAFVVIVLPVVFAVAIWGAMKTPGLKKGLDKMLGYPPPLLSIGPSSTFSFKARAGDVLVAEFDVANVTAEPVRLLGANSSCGCAMAEEDFPIQLNPNVIRKIHVRIKVGSPDSDGHFRRTLELLVNREGAVPPLIVDARVLP